MDVFRVGSAWWLFNTYHAVLYYNRPDTYNHTCIFIFIFIFLLTLRKAGDHKGHLGNVFLGEYMFIYLCDCSQLYTPSCTLRSASDTISLQIPRSRLSIVGSRAFSFFGPSTWNDLSLPLRQKPSLNQTSRHFISQNYRPAMFSIFVLLFSSVSSFCLLPVLSWV